MDQSAAPTVATARERRKLYTFKFYPSLVDRLKARAVANDTSVTKLLEAGAGLVLDGVRKPQPAPRPDLTEDACARCGHGKRSHWARGCMAGCPCGERLYRPKT